jgi:hypothetical protein
MEEYRPFEYEEVLFHAMGRLVELKNPVSEMISARLINSVTLNRGIVYVGLGGRSDVISVSDLLKFYQFVHGEKACGMKG